MPYRLFQDKFPNQIEVPRLPFTPFSYSTCSARDFVCREFTDICENLGINPGFHRKLWEWVFIVFHLDKNLLLKKGKRGLAFGIGSERLPSLFANLGINITATDAPSEVGKDWRALNEYSESLDSLFYDDLVSRDKFNQMVSFRTVDMNDIPDDIGVYDFCWSSCCFEHLGSLQAGINFVLNSLKTLRPGGIAIHTTEYNLSSNDETVESGGTVIYRRRDLEGLLYDATQMGFEVAPLIIAPDLFFMDNYVDVPPYTQHPHLKLDLEGYVATSVGLIIRKP
jgi:SAM-dependent methyltransferase